MRPISRKEFRPINVEKEFEETREEKKKEIEYKRKVNTEDPRYYNIRADFIYLLNYRIKVEAEIGRGGYGVVYQVIPNLLRQ